MKSNITPKRLARNRHDKGRSDSSGRSSTVRFVRKFPLRPATGLVQDRSSARVAGRGSAAAQPGETRSRNQEVDGAPEPRAVSSRRLGCAHEVVLVRRTDIRYVVRPPREAGPRQRTALGALGLPVRCCPSSVAVCCYGGVRRIQLGAEANVSRCVGRSTFGTCRHGSLERANLPGKIHERSELLP